MHNTELAKIMCKGLILLVTETQQEHLGQMDHWSYFSSSAGEERTVSRKEWATHSIGLSSYPKEMTQEAIN